MDSSIVQRNALEFTISNETHVREWFAANAVRLGYSIVISQSACPDYVLRNSKGDLLRVEVEYESANFVQHGHDPRSCDMVMCWKHNLSLIVPVWELSTNIVHEANASTLQTGDFVKLTQSELMGKRKTASLAALKKQGALKDEFLSAIAQDMNAQGEYQKLMIEPRLLLQNKARMIIRCLNKAGVKTQDMDPYDLFDLLFS